MANIETWSTTAALNNSASPNGWPENMSSAGLNDSAREVMAAAKRWYDDPEWLNRNYGATVTRDSATQFTVAGVDATGWFTTNRRVKVVGATTGYGFVVSAVYSSPNTAVTVTMDAADVPTSPTLALVHHSATLSQSAFTGGVPTGCCLPFSGAIANIPSGFLLADGAEVSKTTYAALWAAFGGHLYGTASSPSTHFLLPNMGGKLVIGYVAGGDGDGDYGTVGGAYGEKEHALSVAELPAHDHSPGSDGLTGSDTPAHKHSLAGTWLTSGGTWLSGAGSSTGAGSTDYTSVPIASHYHGLNTVGTDTPHENRQPSVVMAYIVKT